MKIIRLRDGGEEMVKKDAVCRGDEAEWELKVRQRRTVGIKCP